VPLALLRALVSRVLYAPDVRRIPGNAQQRSPLHSSSRHCSRAAAAQQHSQHSQPPFEGPLGHGPNDQEPEPRGRAGGGTLLRVLRSASQRVSASLLLLLPGGIHRRRSSR
jgi:hypothetical protein